MTPKRKAYADVRVERLRKNLDSILRDIEAARLRCDPIEVLKQLRKQRTSTVNSLNRWLKELHPEGKITVTGGNKLRYHSVKEDA